MEEPLTPDELDALASYLDELFTDESAAEFARWQIPRLIRTARSLHMRVDALESRLCEARQAHELMRKVLMR